MYVVLRREEITALQQGQYSTILVKNVGTLGIFGNIFNKLFQTPLPQLNVDFGLGE